MSDEVECLIGCDDKGNYSKIHAIEEELELTHRLAIARRHVGMDVFHGVLPILAIIMGGIIAAHSQEVFLVYEATLLGAFGTAIAFFVEGFWAAYLTEKAEGKKLIEELEKTDKSRLSHSVIVRAERETTLFIALLDGAVPSLTALITLTPMLLPLFGLLDYLGSFYLTIVMGFVVLNFLGIYYAIISEGSIAKNTVRALAAGVFTIAILVLVAILTGA